jgi:hypothetical protein
MQDAHTLQKDDVQTGEQKSESVGSVGTFTPALGKNRSSAESDILIVQLLVDLKLPVKPKRARSASTANVSDVNAHDALPPTKHRACSTPLRNPPPLTSAGECCLSRSTT